MTLKDKARLILEAKQTEFWNEVLKPEFEQRLAALDTQMTSSIEPWQRYGKVEAYSALKDFWMWFDFVIESTRPPEKGPEDVNSGGESPVE